MQRQSLSDIANLAEAMGEEHLRNGKVDIDGIVSSLEITTSFNSYGDAFEGLLEYEDGAFHIYLNRDKLKSLHSPRTRFTKAHEVGHASIEDHKSKLMQGISLSFGSQDKTPLKLLVEREANHFASHLLMPKHRFTTTLAEEQGIEPIIRASKAFSTSIECAALHTINLNISSSLLIKWKTDFSVDYCTYTAKFRKLTGLNGIPPLRINRAYLEEVFTAIKAQKLPYFESASLLSKWIATIPLSARRDFTLLEQTISVGKYGGFTMLTI